MKYTHYGISEKDFNTMLLKKAQTNEYSKNYPVELAGLGSYQTKPESGTGFWASRSDSKYGWEKWCMDNEYKECDLSKSVLFDIRNDAKIYEISNSAQVDALKRDFSLYNKMGFDFEKLAQKYDAIEVTINNDTYYSLYGWDCDSILILNPEIIVAKRQISILNLPEYQLKCCDDIYIDDEKLCFEWETWFDVDAYFGTQTKDTDTWLTFYTDYYRDTGEIKAYYVELKVDRDVEHEWELTDEERELLKQRMIKYTGSSSLEEFYDYDRAAFLEVV